MKRKLGITKVAQARKMVFDTRRAYATGLITMQMVASDDVSLMATDGKRILYNPEHCANVSLQDLSCALMHLVLHKWGNHPARLFQLGNQADMKLANTAYDLAINSMLLTQEKRVVGIKGWATPGIGDWSHLPPEQSGEWYYEKLKEDKQKEQDNEGEHDNTANDSRDYPSGEQESQTPDEDTAGTPEPDEDGTEQPADAEDNTADDPSKPDDTWDDGQGDENDENSDQSDDGTGENGDEGASQDDGGGTGDSDDGTEGESTNESGSGNLDSPPQSYSGDLIPTQDDGNLQEIIKEITAAVASDARNECGAGARASSIIRKMLDDVIAPPTVDWRVILKRYLTERMAKRKRSYARPSRYDGTFILPGYSKDKNICKTALIIDTSGSMNSVTNLIAQQVFELGRIYQQKVVVYMCDTDVRAKFEINSEVDLEQIKQGGLIGGGGTDMTPAFAMAVKDGCKLIINITDMVHDYPPNPRVPVIWADTYGWWYDSYKATYGQRIIIKE